MASMLQGLLTVAVLLLPTGLTWGLKGPPEVIGYLGQPLSLECQYNKYYRTYRKYWCKGAGWSSCHIVVRTDGTEAQVKSDRISIKDNHTLSEFTVRLETLLQEDAGTYWCAIERTGKDPKFQIRVTVLKGLTWGLKGPPEVIGYLGQPLSLECQYDRVYQKYKKYWCKGHDWNSCHIVVRTDGTEVQVQLGRISIKDNHTHDEFTVRLENLSQEDAGIYWCGIEFAGRDAGFRINVTALPEPTPVIITDTPRVPDVSVMTTTSSMSPPFSDYTILLPTVFLVLLIILIGAVLLMCRLKKKKAAKAQKDIPLSLAPSSNSTGEVQYASVRIAPGSVASSPQAPGPNSTEEVNYASVRTEPASAPPQLSTLGDEAIYANVM